MSMQQMKSTPPPAVSDAHPGWSDGVSHWLIHHAARRAPAMLSERLEEEWLADSAERSSALSRLRFAIGCCWATRVIAYEYQPLTAPVAGSALGAKVLNARAQPKFGFISRRTGSFGLVLLLHAAVLYALMSQLGPLHVAPVPPPLQNRYLPQVRPPDVPRPAFAPDLTRFRIEVPPREFKLPPVEDSKTVTETEEPALPQTPPTPPPMHVVKSVQGGPGAGFPDSRDFYPSSAIRMEEHGVATVAVCVDVNGRLTSAPTTVQSSGSARLDEGALKLAKAGSGHYRASTEDGRPVNSCYPIRIRFELKNW
jgi:periplasmic protein TonB